MTLPRIYQKVRGDTSKVRTRRCSKSSPPFSKKEKNQNSESSSEHDGPGWAESIPNGGVMGARCLRCLRGDRLLSKMLVALRTLVDSSIR